MQKVKQEFKISIYQIELIIKELADNNVDRAMIRLLEWRKRYTEFQDSINELRLESSIEVLKISTRSKTRLMCSNVSIVKDLMDLPDIELYKIRFFGKKSIREVLELKEELKVKFQKDGYECNNRMNK